MTQEHFDAQSEAPEPIAIIGLAVRVPGAMDGRQFWTNLLDGRESVRQLSREEQLAAGVTEAELDDPGWVSAAPVLDQVAYFEPELFGMSAREAQLTDPQHRLFLECAHTALEDAGCDPRRVEGPIGVYGGCGHNRYEWLNVRNNPQLWQGEGSQLSVTAGNSPDYLPTQVSYRLNLRGPSIAVRTACSSALVAVHLAAEALRGGECDLALAGGASVELPQAGYLGMEGYLSPDAHCRPFDAGANGTVWGSGAGVVVLKRLSDALADGDHIRAVIRGNAVNNDGADKVSFSAPSVAGQTAVVAQALALSGVDPTTISYVEAHGTGTALGDPIEVAALSAAYGEGSQARQWCAIGSVKSNIGHLSQAAGVVSLVKAVLALEHGVIPPTLHYREPNPEIDFARSPFYVAAAPATFPGQPRRAGVSSFGVGGTNAHLILEQAPPRPVDAVAEAAERPVELLTLSARTATALRTMADQLADHLAAHPEQPLADVAHTLATGRTARAHRGVVVATDPADAASALRDQKRWQTDQAERPPRLVFLFPGQGAQYPTMGAQLYRSQPAYAAAVDECLAGLPGELRQVLFDPAGGEQLAQTRFTQPALFVVEYALARLWESWGVVPEAMIGHSVGEYVAATLAGVFTPAGAARLVATRGELMQSMPPGAMLAVPLDESEVRDRLGDDLVVATVNGPGTCVVAGPVEAVERFADQLRADRVAARLLRTSHAFHSPMMDPILPAFAAEVAKMDRAAPQRPFWSNLTGEPITAEQATDPDYWARHLREAVRFGDCVASLLASPGPWQAVECGPGRQLSGLARLQLRRDHPAPLPSLPSQPVEHDPVAGELGTLHRAAGALWAAGAPVRLPSAPGARRVPLPTYPYERTHHWAQPQPAAPATPAAPADTLLAVPDRYAVPVWRQLPPVGAGEPLPACAVVVAGPRGRELVATLREQGAVVTELAPGADPEPALAVERVVQAAALDTAPAGHDPAAVWRVQEQTFLDGFRLVAAMAASGWTGHLDLVSTGATDPLPGTLTRPEHATLAGLARVAPLEVSGLSVRWIDADDDTPARALVAELASAATGGEVALRAGRRFTVEYEQVSLPAQAPPPRLRPGGRYLVTGGLGGIGITVAEDIARRTGGELVLMSRAGLPPREQWEEYLAAYGGSDRTGRAIAAIKRMERHGATVRVLAADLTDPATAHLLRQQVPAPHGIVHAAGVAGGGMLELRDRADVAAVLDPKLRGTLVLRTAYGEADLDFVVLCSSVTAIVGALGQADYCAANAFLDAYARSDRGWSANLVSVNWGGWSEVGMAAEIEAPQAVRTSGAASPMDHPVLTARAGTRAYGRISADTHWVLDQHRIGGVAVMPGTGHLESARAAVAQLLPPPSPQHLVCLQDVAFVAPLGVPDDTAVRYEVEVVGSGEFRVTSAGARPHAQGRAEWLPATPAPPVDLPAVRKRCSPVADPTASDRHSVVSFGPHWNCLREVYRGQGEELARLELPESALADHQRWVLHPALLDVATTFGFQGSDGAYLPLSYGRVVVRGPLGRQCYSHIRYHPGDGEILSADLTLCGPDGEVLVEISEFTLRRIDPAAVTGDLRSGGGQATADDLARTEAISPEQGVRALWQLLDAGLGPQVAVSTRSVAALRDRVRATGIGASTTAPDTEPAIDPVEPSPAQTTGVRADYVAPRTELERQLAEVWGSVLGVERVGAEDDFFDLGGNSLVAVQLVAQIRSAVRVKLPMRTLFDHPTVAGMAAQVEALRARPQAADEQRIPRLRRQ